MKRRFVNEHKDICCTLPNILVNLLIIHIKDPQFVDMISGSDILGLAETHANEEIFIQGFKLIKQKMREKKV